MVYVQVSVVHALTLKKKNEENLRGSKEERCEHEFEEHFCGSVEMLSCKGSESMCFQNAERERVTSWLYTVVSSPAAVLAKLIAT